jgi:ATP-dependent Clp protease protease subunit
MHSLTRLLALNRGAPRRFEVVNKTDEATIYLYDVIVNDKFEEEYFGGVSAETFVKALNDITAPVIHLRINSPGGDVFAGRVMEQAIRNHASKVIAHVDGYAASAASYVAIAADEVEIAPGGFFMVHNAWTLAMGMPTTSCKRRRCSRRSTARCATPTPPRPARASRT